MEKIEKYITVKSDDNGDLYIELTDEMLKALDAQEGDTIEWREMKDGSWELTKKNDKNK
jgi:hypothetical protein